MRIYLITLLIFSVVCRAIADNDYAPTTEKPVKVHNDKLLSNIIRGRNSSKLVQVKNETDSKEKNTDKKPRTAIHGPPSSIHRDKSSCCGSRHSASPSTRPDPYYTRIPSEGSRYPSAYGDRPVIDRFGWQGRPSGSGSGSTGRPTGGGKYDGNYGGGYSGNQAGDRFGHRPTYGNEGSSRPNGYGSGSSGGYGYGNTGYGYAGGKPNEFGGSIGTGSYGISGTLADGDEFGPGEHGYAEGNPPTSHQGNIHTQKAVALKALAGVALIGAAAALATNPVLLPIGVIAGRRKRSEDSSEQELEVDYILTLLKNNFPRVYSNITNNKPVFTPKCVARLTCEVQKDYISELGSDLKRDPNAARQLPSLIQNSLFNIESLPVNIKALLGLAISVGSSDESCDRFTCSFMGNA